MRLGQLARKNDIPVQDLIDYLEEIKPDNAPYHANFRLEGETEELVLAHFDIQIEELEETPDTSEEVVLAESVTERETESLELKEPEVVQQKEPEATTKADPKPEKKSKPPIPESPLDDIMLAGGEIMSLPDDVEKKTEQEKIQPSLREDEVIQTDKLLEMLESEELPPNLDKVKLIKAPKKELSGLKVVGKIELPEPKKKEKKEEKPQRTPSLSEEEKERRRLKAKRKKEAHAARQEKRRKEWEKKQEKERKTAYYQQKLEKAKQEKLKLQQKSPAQAKKSAPPKPKTILGKFWRWMNT